jgi:hypothetical protein
MENFTIHIFGYGETQINSKELSIKVKTTQLTTVQALIDCVFLKKPKESKATIDKYHVINIFGYDDVRWLESKESTFNDKKDEELKAKIDDLIAELKAVFDALPAQN